METFDANSRRPVLELGDPVRNDGQGNHQQHVLDQLHVEHGGHVRDHLDGFAQADEKPQRKNKPTAKHESYAVTQTNKSSAIMHAVFCGSVASTASTQTHTFSLIRMSGFCRQSNKNAP